VVGQLITLQFGREVQFVQSPVTGAVAILGESYSEYRLILVILAVILAVAMGLVLNGTRLGLQTRAVIMNENLARGLGINSGLVRFATFSIGSGLAALAGALITPPRASIRHGRAVAGERLMLVLVSGMSLVSLAVFRCPAARRCSSARTAIPSPAASPSWCSPR
jgi:branched-chain amino acid transport system permease protein